MNEVKEDIFPAAICICRRLVKKGLILLYSTIQCFTPGTKMPSEKHIYCLKAEYSTVDQEIASHPLKDIFEQSMQFLQTPFRLSWTETLMKIVMNEVAQPSQGRKPTCRTALARNKWFWM